MVRGLKLTLYLVCALLYLVVIALWIAIPDEITLNVATSIMSLTLTSILLIWDRRRFQVLYTSLWFRCFRSLFLSAFLISCILGLINYLFFKNPVQWDFSQFKKNTLTEQTIKILRGLKGDENLTFHIFSNREQRGELMALLDFYRLERKQTSIEVVDVELRPDLVQKFHITMSPTVVVQYGIRRAQVRGEVSELSLTNAIVKVSRNKDPVLYYSNGHGEHPWEGEEGKEKNGMSELSNLLKNAYFQVRPVDLSTLPHSRIPPEVDGLIIWGPKTSFHKNELDLIDGFLKRKGKLLVAIGPDLAKDRVPRLRKLLSKWGVRMNNDLVVDNENHISGSKGTVPTVKNIGTHLITEHFKGTLFFPLVSSVVEAKMSRSAPLRGRFTPLALTSDYPSSWAERNPEEVLQGTIRFHSKRDLKGPVPLAAVWEGGEGTRIMAVGNSSFVSNGYLKFGNHLDFIRNGLSWLVDKGQVASFNLPSLKDVPVFISAPQLGIIFYFSVVFAPLLLFGMAIYVYKFRQKS